MSDQLLPDFDGPVQPPEQPSPRKPKPRPQRKRPAKKKVRAAPVPKPAKRVPKKRRTRQVKPVTALVSISRLPALMDASENIATILESLSREERDIVLRSPRVMKRLS